MTKKLLLLLYLSGWIISASGINYFVSPRGSDTNEGTSLLSPFKTISAAAMKAAAGDSVYITEGNYSERIIPNASGTATAPVVYTKYRNSGAVILTTPLPDIANENKLYAFILTNRNHIVIDGIDFRECNGWILMDKANHNTITNCSFDGSRVYCSIKINSGSYNKILNCNFIRAVDVTWKGWEPARGADFITIWRDSHYNLIEGCRFNAIPHDCIGIHGREPSIKASHNIIRNCIFDNPTWKAIGLHNSEYTLVENNVCFGDAANFLQFEASKVIMRRNLFYRYHDTTKGLPEPGFRGVMRLQSVLDEYKCHNLARHNRIYNNLFYGNERTITNFSVKLPVFDNIFKNNIFYKNQQTIHFSNPDYRGENKNFFVSNILSGTAKNEKFIHLLQDQYTLQEAELKLPDIYRKNRGSDPMFVNEAENDFHLRKGSPCIDKGEFLTTAKESGNGNEITVEDPLYFSDGYGLIEGDLIRIGKNRPVRILKIFYETGKINLSKKIKWSSGDSVNLDFTGKAPDIGPFEYYR